MQEKRPILIGISSGVTVFLFGFAMMYFMWTRLGSPLGLIRYENQTFYVVGNSVLGGIAQDGLTASLIILFVICMPCLYIGVLKGIDIEAIVDGIVLISVAFAPVKFCIHNNVEHMERQREVLEDYPNEEKMWNVLHKCLVRQSKQTIFAMLPYVCLVAGKEFLQKLVQSKTWREAIKELINTYIDKLYPCIMLDEGIL